MAVLSFCTFPPASDSMDLTCLISTVQPGGGGVMLWGMHKLGPLKGKCYGKAHFFSACAYINYKGSL